MSNGLQVSPVNNASNHRSPSQVPSESSQKSRHTNIQVLIFALFNIKSLKYIKIDIQITPQKILYSGYIL